VGGVYFALVGFLSARNNISELLTRRYRGNRDCSIENPVIAIVFKTATKSAIHQVYGVSVPGFL
jgi:hypothetical protein